MENSPPTQVKIYCLSQTCAIHSQNMHELQNSEQKSIIVLELGLTEIES